MFSSPVPQQEINYPQKETWIMFTVGNDDRYIGRHSIDIAVDSRSIVDR